ncbi:hypothetical protein BDV96DRAFT_4563 [Lophiotrema nucula]|uniref:Uncharacterized protein n=1 Tax=Lophiotrema nucula TaxID=690887 RepID=A0A6A5ZV69_9PLEO|nr:hypothetical protein BDV96DRAFT_4563 [Lophiotrema nucula]
MVRIKLLLAHSHVSGRMWFISLCLKSIHAVCCQSYRCWNSLLTMILSYCSPSNVLGFGIFVTLNHSFPTCIKPPNRIVNVYAGGAPVWWQAQVRCSIAITASL